MVKEDTYIGFNSAPIIDSILELLNDENVFSPLMIDGPWGVGKSRFVEQLVSEIEKNKEFKVSNINAFLYDHTDDPLLTILSHVADEITLKEDLRQKISPLFKAPDKLILRSVVHGIKGTEVGKLLAGFTDSLVSSMDEATFKNHLQKFKELNENIKALGEVISDGLKDKKRIIIIDELDRCKPQFALDTLEVIKHVFEIERVFFIIVSHEEYLKTLIDKNYGADKFSEKYFHKFYKYRIGFQNTYYLENNQYKPRNKAFELLHKKLYDYNLASVNYEVFFQKYSFVLNLFHQDRYTMRDAEMIFRNTFRLKINNKSNNFVLNQFHLIASIIHHSRKDLSRKFLNKTVEVEDIDSLFIRKNLLGLEVNKSENSFERLHLAICYGLAASRPEEGVSRNKEEALYKKLEKYTINHNTAIHWFELLEQSVRKLNFL